MKLRVSNLRKVYADAGRELVVIDNLNFEFPESGSVAISGRSGTGKSTLLHLLGGLDRTSSGEVYYDDQAISGMGNDELSHFRGERVGFVFQFHHLMAEFSAVENVAMPLLIAGVDAGEANGRAVEVLKRVGLGERLTHRPGELSGGEQQRVAIARAVVTRPAVILADEPTGNLDLATASAVDELLLGLAREAGCLLIAVTHNQDLAGRMDRALEMKQGGELIWLR